MRNVKKRFEEVADEYDEEFVKLIPHYQASIEALINTIPFDENKEIKILDLGCGTGVVTKNLKELFPNSTVTCLDLSPKMIEIAKEKLKNYKGIEFFVGDFLNFEFEEGYDAVLSSLAIHHINDNDKKTLYKRIYNILNKGGIFYNNDRVEAPTNHLQKVYHDAFVNNLRKNYGNEKIEEIDKIADDNDIPSKLYEQLQWLEEVGFKSIDVVWKYYAQGVFGGEK
ncbi:class I SAM-dependent methyltransferase [Methanobrevibacter curvatus]|uniref:Putative methyltransferase n=1 Tax=Methanobrevibacter curvatus TaxID=49547 RepID=A0A166E8R3_9EURY|nr:class I SAM-dependent methyltransferase [Methanobrevibacter curvatus]KZX16398.1 putative methyltransferase [Methanobrevibacter curvatus]